MEEARHHTSRSHSRSRSRSPARYEEKRAGHHHHHRHHHARHRSHSDSPRHGGSSSRSSQLPPLDKPLPLNARQLSKHDLPTHRPMFALYLDIQKRIDIDELDGTEIKGRWKSFVSKWNRGDLAEGWYDPKTLAKAQEQEREQAQTQRQNSSPVNDRYATEPRVGNNQGDEEDEDEDDYGPPPPDSAMVSQGHASGSKDGWRGHHGATIPSLQDLRSRDEQAREDADEERAAQQQNLKHSRALDRKLQRERLDEMAPRAEPGTRERQLEKKREKAESNRAFASAKDGGGEVEVRDADMMGDEDSLGEIKRMQKERERKKNERELRKEEILRARRAEREARVAGMKEKEEKTMSMLREIARQRFGGGGNTDDG
ncbi:uncharacterized protein PV06_02426 [Exophiala oligosperma]|uniref:Uncharacterized protein n=2 Tax=Exophiala oligosperma TaxID=215243 RepID=A0A0D2EFS5_9EURO|nr:uncharacterized protein PV06_02426 [Exophiala oligosperma]KIW46789.1 hypothetical protein PV06_02426 [Exophiala oligosperma]